VAPGVEEYDAALTVTYKKLQVHETFISHVIADHNDKTVKSTSSSGPVKKMTSLWRIKDLPEGGAEIEYSIDYTLRSKTMQVLLSGLFDLALRRVMAAFEQRAHALYDKKVA
jgi:coenzyme Q-binding protein COQ10